MSINIASLSGIQRYADQHGKKNKGKNDGVASKAELTAIANSPNAQPVTKEAVDELITNFDKINTGEKKGGLTAAEVDKYLSDFRKSKIAGEPKPGVQTAKSDSTERLQADHERQPA